MLVFLKNSILILVVLVAVSCESENKNPNNKTVGSIKESSHYIYVLPKDTGEIKGIVVVLDPHSLPYNVIDSLEGITHKYNIAIMGLLDIKNGIHNFQEIISRDISHFINFKKLKAPKIYLVGFSGAARMASVYAKNNRIDGIVACGAGLGRQYQFPFPTVMISGTRDFNFMEQYYNFNNPLTYQRNTIALHFRGNHQWPHASLLEEGISFIINRGKYGNYNLAPHYDSLAVKYFLEKDYLLYFKNMEIAYKLSNDKDIERRKETLDKISKNAKVKYYFNRMEKQLSEELDRYADIEEYIDMQDTIWWKNQIKYFDYRSKKIDVISADSYARTKAYMGVLMYSKVRACVNGKDEYIKLPKYLKIYELLEPENPELHFYKAVYFYSLNREKEALLSLRKAEELGFDNIEEKEKYFSVEFLEK